MHAVNIAMMDYWLCNVERKHKIHWIGWEKLMMPKELGGISFRDMQYFN